MKNYTPRVGSCTLCRIAPLSNFWVKCAKREKLPTLHTYSRSELSFISHSPYSRSGKSETTAISRVLIFYRFFFAFEFCILHVLDDNLVWKIFVLKLNTLQLKTCNVFLVPWKYIPGTHVRDLRFHYIYIRNFDDGNRNFPFMIVFVFGLVYEEFYRIF